MTHSPAKVIQFLIVQSGLGVMGGSDTNPPPWRTFAHSSSPNGVKIMAVFGTQGVMEGKNIRNGRVTEHFGIQVMTFSSGDPETAAAKAAEVAKYLTEQVNRTAITVASATGDRLTANYIVHSISQIGSVIPVGQEETEKRFRFSTNFTATIEELV